jgi:hypothetical protein
MGQIHAAAKQLTGSQKGEQQSKNQLDPKILRGNRQLACQTFSTAPQPTKDRRIRQSADVRIAIRTLRSAKNNSPTSRQSSREYIEEASNAGTKIKEPTHSEKLASSKQFAARGR